MAAVPLMIVLLFLAVLLVVVLVVVGIAASRRNPSARPVAAPVPSQQLAAEAVTAITAEVDAGRKIPAIKMLREHTGLGLKDAKDRVEAWDGPAELRAASRPSGTPTGTSDDNDVMVAARAVREASGWHTAEAYLREQRGLSAEEARAVLDSLGP